jgi:hypothetical protein
MAAREGGPGGVRPGAGRKPKALEEKQRNRAMVSLTDAEYAAILAAAGDEPIGSFIRRVVLRSLARRRAK